MTHFVSPMPGVQWLATCVGLSALTTGGIACTEERINPAPISCSPENDPECPVTLRSDTIPDVFIGGERLHPTVIQPTLVSHDRDICHVYDMEPLLLKNGGTVPQSPILELKALLNGQSPYAHCFVTTAFGPGPNGIGYLLDSSGGQALRMDLDEVWSRLDRPSFAIFSEDMAQIGAQELWLPVGDRDIQQGGGATTGLAEVDLSAPSARLVWEKDPIFPSSYETRFFGNFFANNHLLSIVWGRSPDDPTYESISPKMLQVGVSDIGERKFEGLFLLPTDPIVPTGAETIEGVPFSDLAPYLIVSTTIPFPAGNFLWTAQSPDVDTEILPPELRTGLHFQSGPSTLLRYDMATASSVTFPLPCHGVKTIGLSEETGQLLVIGMTDSYVAPDGFEVLATPTVFFVNPADGSIERQQTLTAPVEEDGASVFEISRDGRTILMEYRSLGSYVNAVFNYQDGSFVDQGLPMLSDISTTPFRYRTEENPDLEFEFLPDGPYLDPRLRWIDSRVYEDPWTSRVVYRGANRDFIYVDTPNKRAYYFRAPDGAPCSLFWEGGLAGSTCPLEDGATTLFGDEIYTATQNQVLRLFVSTD